MTVIISEFGEVVYERLWVERVAIVGCDLVLYEKDEEIYRCRLYIETSVSIVE